MAAVRVALIGAGSMANRVHYPSLASFDDVELVGLCDVVPEKLAATAETFGIRATYTDYRRMLTDVECDAVYALMPPHVLFDVAMDVLSTGSNLFIEKPPAVTTHQTQCLARKAADTGAVTAVGFQRRYHPLVHHCFEKVRDVGQPHQVVSHFLKNTQIGDAYPYYRGAIDILRCDAVHAVDALRYYCGLSDVRAVASDVRYLDSWYPVTFNALVHFANDTVGILHVNWRTGTRSLKFEFHAAGASAYVDADGEARVWIAPGKEPEVDTSCSKFAGSEEMRVTQGFLQENRAFIDAVKSDSQLHNNLQDAVKTMQLADAIYANAINQPVSSEAG